MTSSPPESPIPANAFRVTLEVRTRKPRLDQVLLEALRAQKTNMDLHIVSRAKFKELFKEKRIRIKGQAALPSSAIAAGITHVDILGFS
jgi:hypothetical protein